MDRLIKKITSVLLFSLISLQLSFAQNSANDYAIIANSDNDIEKIQVQLHLLNYYSRNENKDSVKIIINNLHLEYESYFEEEHLDYLIGKSIEDDDEPLALKYYLKAFEVAINNNDSIYIALSKIKIAGSDSLINNYQESSKYLFEALTYLKSISYDSDLDEVYYQLGNIFLRIKEINKSKTYYLKGYSIAKKTKDEKSIAFLSNGLANIYFFEDSLDKSLEYFKHTLEYLKKQKNHKEIALLENNISIVLDDMGRKTEAIEHARKSLDARMLLLDTAGIASSSLNVAFFFNEQEIYDSALYFLNTAINYAKLKNKHDVLVRSLKGISLVYQNIGNFERALEYYKRFKHLDDSIYKNNHLKEIQKYEKEKDLSFKKLDNKLQIQTYKNKLQRNIFLIVILIILLLLTAIFLFVVYRSNISKRKFSEEIFQNLKLLEILMETVPDPIYYMNENGIYVGCNRAFCNFVGKEKGQIIGKNREDIYERFHIKDFTQNEEQIVEKNQTIKLDKRFVDEDGKEIFLQFHSAPFFISKTDSKGRIGLVIDMTKQKEVENELRSANESKELFMSIISHDIRNSFNVVLAFTSLLNDDYDNYSDKKRIELIANIHEASNNTYLLLENLLGWSRAQQGGIIITKKNIDVVDILDESIDLLRPASNEKNIKIINQVDTYYLNIDENSIKTVFRNLISNAIKFSNKGDSIRIYSENSDSYLRIHFEDKGTGISEENQKYLFEIDKNTQRLGTNNESGSGLGLLLTAELMKLNNGRIEVESKEGEGSRFTVCLKNE